MVGAPRGAGGGGARRTRFHLSSSRETSVERRRPASVSSKAAILCIWGKPHQGKPTCPLPATQGPQACPRGSQVRGLEAHCAGDGGRRVCVGGRGPSEPGRAARRGTPDGVVELWAPGPAQRSRAASSGAQRPRFPGLRGGRRVVHGHRASRSRGEGAWPSLGHLHGAQAPLPFGLPRPGSRALRGAGPPGRALSFLAWPPSAVWTVVGVGVPGADQWLPNRGRAPGGSFLNVSGGCFHEIPGTDGTTGPPPTGPRSPDGSEAVGRVAALSLCPIISRGRLYSCAEQAQRCWWRWRWHVGCGRPSRSLACCCRGALPRAFPGRRSRPVPCRQDAS